MSAYTVAPPDEWVRIKDDYLCGVAAADLCRRHGVSRSQFYERARREGWRRVDQAGARDWSGEEDPAFDPEAPAPPAAELAEVAWRRAAHAIAHGLRREAQGWTRLARDLRALARAAAAPPAPAPSSADDRMDALAEVAAAAGEIARAAGRVLDVPLGDRAQAALALDRCASALERRLASLLVDPSPGPAATPDAPDAPVEPDTPDSFAPPGGPSPPPGEGRSATGSAPAPDLAAWLQPDTPDSFASSGPAAAGAASVAAPRPAPHIGGRQGASPMFFKKVLDIPTREQALPGRDQAIPTAKTHYVNGHALQGPYPDGMETAEFGMGCFWGVERIFWQVPGVHVTAVGYSGGVTPNPSYEEVCSGRTGQNETVLVVFDPKAVSYDQLLKVFWEGHDPTQGMRQGNDAGTQYRSAIYTHSPAQQAAAEASKTAYQAALGARGYGAITTEIKRAGPFYFAEGYHQQYLAKNPGGYCGIGGTGVDCPAGLSVDA